MLDFDKIHRDMDFNRFLPWLGYEIDKRKSCARYPVYKKGDDKVILSSKNIFFVHQGKNGNFWSFLKERPHLVDKFPGKFLQQVEGLLREYFNLPAEALQVETSRSSYNTRSELVLKDDSHEFSIPVVKDVNTFEFRFLKARGITQETMNTPIFKNIGLYRNGRCNNVAFPMFINEEIKGLELRNVGFKGLASGSQKGDGAIWRSSPHKNINEIVIGESAIDMLSYHQLHYDSGKIDILYISTSGNPSAGQLGAIMELANRYPTAKINLAYDNDLQGLDYRIMTLLNLLSDKKNIITPVYISQIQNELELPPTVVMPKDIPPMAGVEVNSTPERTVITYDSRNEDTLNMLSNFMLNIANRTLSRQLVSSMPSEKDWNDIVQKKNNINPSQPKQHVR